jgi:hypothetical protein
MGDDPMVIPRRHEPFSFEQLLADLTHATAHGEIAWRAAGDGALTCQLRHACCTLHAGVMTVEQAGMVRSAYVSATLAGRRLVMTIKRVNDADDDMGQAAQTGQVRGAS